MPFNPPATRKHTCHKIVHPETNIHDQTKSNTGWRRKWHTHRMTICLVQRHDKADRLYEIGSVSQQGTTFYQGFMHQGKVKIRKVADACMDELGRFTTCATGKVYFLNKRDLVTTRDSIQGYTSPCNAATDYQDIKLLTSQERQVVRAHR